VRRKRDGAETVRLRKKVTILKKLPERKGKKTTSFPARGGKKEAHQKTRGGWKEGGGKKKKKDPKREHIFKSEGSK